MISKKFFSLQYKVLVFSFVIMIIPIMMLGFLSFNKSSEVIKQKVSLSNLYTVEQIGNNISFIVQNIRDTSLYLIQNDGVRDFLKLSGNESYDLVLRQRIKVETDLMQLLSSKVSINSIYIKGFNDLILNTSGYENIIDDREINEAKQLRGKPIWYLDQIINYNGVPKDVLSMVRIINDVDNIPNKLAILKINIDTKTFYNIYKDKVIGSRDDLFIVNEKGIVLSATNQQKVGTLFDDSLFGDRLREAEGCFEADLDSRRCLITYYTIGDLNWKIINIVPLSELLKENNALQKVIITAMLISFFICVVIAILFSRSMVQRLRQLKNMMKKLKHEDFDVYIEPRGNDEITLLANSFNKMSEKLKELILKVYTVQIKQREAELQALQAQINPHFLYNTLDNIYWMGRMEKAFDTCKLVEALSKLFRLSLNSGREISTVRKEIDHVRNYMIIQQVRYRNMITFTLNVNDEVLDCITLKLVLQPLIENAIVHGIEKKGDKGDISITINRQDDRLVYIVEDNGCGLDVGEVKKLLEKPMENNRGIAIKNVNDRIKIYFGEEYGLDFISTTGKTTAIVTQPFKKEEVALD